MRQRAYESVRKAAKIHCERLGHNLTPFIPIASGEMHRDLYPHKARCVQCSRYVIVNGVDMKFEPDSGLHGAAPLVACTNDRPNDERPMNSYSLPKWLPRNRVAQERQDA